MNEVARRTIWIAVLALTLAGCADKGEYTPDEVEHMREQLELRAYFRDNDYVTPEEEYDAELCVDEGRLWNYGDNACVVPHGLDG